MTTTLPSSPSDQHGWPWMNNLIRQGIRAASSHNSQPWKFCPGTETLTIFPDYERRCPVVDPDDAHLFKSLGCAAENIRQTAALQHFETDITYNPELDAVTLTFRQSDNPYLGCSGSLARAIPNRQTSRTTFDESEIFPFQLLSLEKAALGEGVRPIILNNEEDIQYLADLVAEGDRIQLSDPAFREELYHWIRLNKKEAQKTGDGLFSRSTGKPSLPSWLRGLLPHFVRSETQSKSDHKNVLSSPVIIALVSKENNKTSWVEAGCCAERLALQATIMGIQSAYINQPIEVPHLRNQLHTFLDLEDEHVQLLFRIGYGPTRPFSPRRPLEDVLA